MSMTRVATLIKCLDSRGLFVAASEVYKFIALASFEEYKDRIMEAAGKNVNPFNHWFGESNRVFLDINAQSSGGSEQAYEREAALRKEFPPILSWIQLYFNEDPSKANLLSGRLGSGRKMGDKFFRGVLDRRLKILADGWAGKLNISSKQFSSLFQTLYLQDFIFPRVSDLLVSVPDELVARFNIAEDIFLGNEFEKITLARETDNIISDVSYWSKEYLSSPLRSHKAESNFKVVISQDPKDIATMSTGRRWTSCTELGSGIHYTDVFCELETGGLIAYLINSNDLEIESPLARIWLRRFTNDKGESVVIPEEEIYGDDMPGFMSTVKEWVGSKQGDLEYGTYKLKGAGWSDTFDKVHNLSPDDPETLEDMFLNTEKYVGNVTDNYSVTDDFYYNYDNLFEPEHEGYPYLSIYHIKEQKIFETLEEAKEFVSGLGNNWKWAVQEHIDADSEFANLNDYGEQDEEEPYTHEGQQVNEYISGEKERFDITKIPAEDRIKGFSTSIRASVYSKAMRSPKLVSEALARAMYDAYKHDLSENFSSKARNIVLTLPQFFSKEEIDGAVEGILTESNYAKLYSSLEDGERKDELRTFLLDDAERKIDFDEIKKEYSTKKRADRNRYGSQFLSGIYFTLAQLSRDVAIPGRITNKVVDVFRQVEGNPDIPSTDQKTIAKELVYTLGASNADNRATIDLYKELIPRIKISTKLRKAEMRKLIYGPDEEYKYTPGLGSIGRAIASTGRAGEPLIPLLEDKFREIDSLTEEDLSSAVKYGQKFSDLNAYKSRVKESVLYIIDSIRTGDLSKKYEYHL